MVLFSNSISANERLMDLVWNESKTLAIAPRIVENPAPVAAQKAVTEWGSCEDLAG
jgi:hypothetical protein